MTNEMKISRRTFLGALAAVVPNIPIRETPIAQILPIGLQLYTVRRELEEDFEGTLKRVAALGIKDVEFPEYFGRSQKEIRESLDRFGLTSTSSHIDTATLRGDLGKACEAADAIGHKYLVLGWLPPEERKSLDDYKRLIELLNRGVETCERAGITLGYHNHDFEFTEMDGKIPYHLIVTETGAMPLELDVYWATKAGRDPLKMIKSHPARVRLLHLKDMSEGGDFAEVGSGTIDFKAILSQAAGSSVKHCFVEQDETPGDPFDSVSKSLAYLRSVGY